jgi:hypothetical protein
LTRLPLIAAGLIIFLGARFLARRRQRTAVRLRNGRTVELLSSVALLHGSDNDLLALEYISELPDPASDDLRTEAHGLLQAIGSRVEYASCRSALVSVRRRGDHRADRDSQEVTFTFHRPDASLDWHASTEGGSPP